MSRTKDKGFAFDTLTEVFEDWDSIRSCRALRGAINIGARILRGRGHYKAARRWDDKAAGLRRKGKLSKDALAVGLGMISAEITVLWEPCDIEPMNNMFIDGLRHNLQRNPGLRERLGA